MSSFLLDDFFTSELLCLKGSTSFTNNNHQKSYQHHHHHHHHHHQPTSAALQYQEIGSKVRLSMDIPGINGNDLEVSVQHGVLSIRGSRNIRAMDGRIRKKQRLCRRFAVDTETVDVSKANANISKGVLVISAPKKVQPKPVWINVPEHDQDYDIL